MAETEEEWSVPRPQRAEWSELLRKAESEYENPSQTARIAPEVIARVLSGDMKALELVCVLVTRENWRRQF